MAISLKLGMQIGKRGTKLQLALGAASELAAKPDPNNGPCVLGIDAACTAHQPSGITLVQNTVSGWSCLAVAPGYDTFIT